MELEMIRIGYSSLFWNMDPLPDGMMEGPDFFEAILAILCLFLYVGWWLADMYRLYDLNRDYCSYIKSNNITEDIKKILCRIKFWGIAVFAASGLSILCGMSTRCSVVALVLSAIFRISFIIQLKNLGLMTDTRLNIKNLVNGDI